jgi:hypothetical protein
MREIQDVPIGPLAVVSMKLIKDGRPCVLEIDYVDATSTANLVVKEFTRMSKLGYILVEFAVLRMSNHLTSEDIAASIRRKQPRRTLLAVQSQEVFADDIDVSEYWKTDVAATRELLSRDSLLRSLRW